MKTFLHLLVILLVAGVLAGCGTTVPQQTGEETLGVISGQYIVTLAQAELSRLSEPEFDTAVATLSRDHRAVAGRPLRIINGFVATELDADDVASLLTDPRVAAVEPDRIVAASTTTQANAGWNLDRIDQRARPLDNAFTYGPSGAGVTIYVVDSGIRSTHDEFAGRLAPGYTVISDGRGTEDCASHGTAVASAAGGTTYGVAKGATLVPVRVLNCDGSGSVSGVIAGLDWVAEDRRGPAVVNLSLGSGPSNAFDTAVKSITASGIIVVNAAGNASADACDYSPGRVAEVVTTGATTSRDVRSASSNFGRCIDVFAPGSNVRVAFASGDTDSGTLSGTSLASPNVAGVAALILEGRPTATPAEVASLIVDAATKNVLSDVGSGSPNLLLFADAAWPKAAAGTEPPPGGGEPDPDPDPEPDPDPDPEPDPDPDPEPDPEPSGPPCSDCDVFSGSLDRTGSELIFPTTSAGSYTTSTTSLHMGWLRGPDAADFDLYLERLNRGGRWGIVARSTNEGSDEEIAYAGKSGTYRWRVVSASGSGDFVLYLSLP